jgi:hypothetical protein
MDDAAAQPRRLMRAALEAARAGHFVIPLWPRSKRAISSGWEAAATRDEAVIVRRWRARPWNVAIACGPSNLVVLDLDDAHGQEPPEPWGGARHGRDVLGRLAAAAGEPYPSRTLVVRTPSGGVHLYFRAPPGNQLRNTVGRLGWRVDSRGAGGYVVAAGSVRPEGMYRAVNRAPIAPLPDWLVAALTPPPVPDPADIARCVRRTSTYVHAAVRGEVDAVVSARVGERHNTLLRAAGALGQLVAGGVLDEYDARTALRAAAAVHIGQDRWTEREADTTIAAGLTFGAARPRRITNRRG